MPMLQFRGVFVPKIIDGTKTQTVRSKLGSGFAVGSTLRLQNGYHRRAHIRNAVIDGVEERTVGQLTQRDAELDGFASLDALRSELAATYPGKETVWLVRWRDFVPAGYP